MRAVSRDLVHRRKTGEAPLFALESMHVSHKWGDPFVFWNYETREYWMLLTTRLRGPGRPRTRGCTALAVSKDLTDRVIRDPFFAPGDFGEHECPDLFKSGDCCVVYADGRVAFSTRMFDRSEGGLGLFVDRGVARFEGADRG